MVQQHLLDRSFLPMSLDSSFIYGWNILRLPSNEFIGPKHIIRLYDQFGLFIPTVLYWCKGQLYHGSVASIFA